MKKFFLALSILFSVLSCAQTGTTSAGQFKMNAPVLGTVQDSCTVWNGTDKKIKFLPFSSILTLQNLLNNSSYAEDSIGANNFGLNLIDGTIGLTFSNGSGGGVFSENKSTSGYSWQYQSPLSRIALMTVNGTGHLTFAQTDEGNTVTTEVGFEEPTATTSWKVPAKSAGDYLFASEQYVDDAISGVSGSSNDLNATTLLGNFTEQDIEFTAGAALKFNSGVWTGEMNGIGLSANRSWSMFDASGYVAHSVLGAAAGSNGDITPPNAVADNTTKGVSSFTSADFDSSLGNISIDYTNGQSASASTKGFLTSTDWSTFNGKQATLVSGTSIKSIESNSLLGSGNIDLTKSDVGLSNVDNTSDTNKPISTATQTALDKKLEPISRTGVATSPTSSTTEVEMLRVTLPIGTVTGDDWLTISRLYIVKTNANSTLTVRIKLSTTGTLPSGTTGQIGVFTTSSTAQTTGIMRKYWQDGTNLYGAPFTTSFINDAGQANAGAPSSIAFNNSTTQYYLHVSFTLNSSSDSAYIAAHEITN
ncbi:hypothetical protein [Flavobacterium sp. 25HG05S-40]|uniref:hypothetical protein n=1 Tax=Flavobacterium sp. 25HG05S-40 TaxID=3458682 RepID=UPI0040442276